MIEHTFLKGPEIAIQVLATDSEGFKIKLMESNQFTAFFSLGISLDLRGLLLSWLTDYSEKKNPPPFSFPRQNLPPFTLRVLHAMQRIPFGKTCSYQELAMQSQSPKASRAVGNVCRLNSFPLLIPCHRVLPKDGSLGEFAFGSSLKKELLRFERAI